MTDEGEVRPDGLASSPECYVPPMAEGPHQGEAPPPRAERDERESSIDRRLGLEISGRYRILATVATGGMGVIYRGERLQLGRPVAIKFLHRQVAQDPEFLGRFSLEARAMSRLSSPHCVSVIDFGVEAGSPYLVMDFVDGINLGDLLRRGPVPVERALPIIRQVLEGLAHAHKQGIVHRDIKPDNIILTAHTGFGDFVRILDFGLAKLSQAETSGRRNPTAPGIALGTPSYMSPEQTLADTLDARSDLYSTGVVLHELLTGNRPFRAKQMGEVFKLHREAPVPRLSENAPSGTRFSRELETLVQRAMAKTPAGRFQSALEMAAALDATPEGRRTTAPRLGVPVPAEAADFDLSGRAGAEPPAPTVALPSSLPDGGPALRVERGAAPAESAAGAPAEPSPRAPETSTSTSTRAESTGTWVGRVRGQRRRTVALGVAGLLVVVGGMTWLARRHGPAALDEPPGAATVAAAGAAGSAAAAAGDATGFGGAGPGDPTVRSAGATSPEAAPPELSAPAPAETGAAAPPVTAADPKTLTTQLARVERMIESGQHRPAILALLRLRRGHPRSARVMYLLGNIYSDKQWWSDAFMSYRAALRLDPGYRGDLVLRRHLVLVSQKSRRFGTDAQRLLTQMGR
jgi:serine/threonine-protein kinase